MNHSEIGYPADFVIVVPKPELNNIGYFRWSCQFASKSNTALITLGLQRLLLYGLMFSYKAWETARLPTTNTTCREQNLPPEHRASEDPRDLLDRRSQPKSTLLLINLAIKSSLFIEARIKSWTHIVRIDRLCWYHWMHTKHHATLSHHWIWT